jgi:PAS domain S-box-containing protein
MTAKKASRDDFTRFRQAAEKILVKKNGRDLDTADQDPSRILHELEVHQIELDLQDEELQRTVPDLETARNEFADLFHLAPVGFLTLTEGGGVERYNQAALALLPNLIKYPTNSLFQNLIYSEDIPVFFKAMRDIIDSGDAGAGQTVELRLEPSSGVPIWVRLDIGASVSRGRVIQWRLSILDITDRKQAEKLLKENESKFRSSFDNAAIGFAIGTREGAFLEMNRAYCTLTGYTRAELRAMRYLKLIHPDDVEENMKLIDKLCHRRIPAFTIENRYIRKDGSVVHVRKSVSLTSDVYGEQEWIVAFVEDVSDRWRFEKELERSRDELEARVKERTHKLSRAIKTLHKRSGQLRKMAAEVTLTEQRERQRLATLLHDGLQQLLVGAHFQLEIMEQDQSLSNKTLQLKETLDKAIQASRSLAMELHPPVLLGNDLCAALRWLAGWMLDMHGLRVRLKIPESIRSLSYDMLLLIFQSVREILFNVVKHAGVKKAVVEVSQQSDEILLTVEDKGAGFDPKRLLLQGKSSGGFGLFGMRERLPIFGVRTIIRSSPGKGSRIGLRIPLPSATKKTIQALDIEGVPDSKTVFPGRDSKLSEADERIRILLVDDQEVLRRNLTGLIDREPDLQVVGEACDGKTAIKIARNVQLDVVLMDINMPVMSGIRATEIIHRELPGVQIIGLSVFEDETQKNEMFKAGAAAYFTKSGETQELMSLIRSCTREVSS